MESVAKLKADVIIGHGVCVSGNLVVCPISTIGKYSYGQAKLFNENTYNISGFTFADNDNDFVLLRLDYDSARPIKMGMMSRHRAKVFLCVENAGGSLELKEGRRQSKDFRSRETVTIGRLFPIPFGRASRIGFFGKYDWKPMTDRMPKVTAAFIQEKF